MASGAVAVAVDPDFEPSENWDDDFEFNATPGPSSPAPSSRTRRHKRSQNDPYQHPPGGSTTKSSLAVLPAGTRISLASSEFTMEDWDAESIMHQSPPRVTTSFTTAIIGSGDEEDEEEFGQTPTKTRAPPRAWGGDSHVGVVFHDPHALPVSLSIALAPWSEEPEMLLPKTPVKVAMALQPAPLGDVEENWDQDFEESDEPTEDVPRRKLSLKARLEEEAHESWDEEFAAEEAEAEARQWGLHQVDLGMGPPPPASRRTPKKSPTAPRRKVSKGKSGIVPSSSSSSASEGEGHPLHHSYRRQKPNRGSKRSSEARYSLSEDGDFYDSSDDEEFGLRLGGMHNGEEEEEDKTVTQRSRKGIGYFKPPKHASPPPPVPKLPDSVFRVPSSPRSPANRLPSSYEVVGPSRSPMLSFSPPPLPNASSPTPFPRSPTSSVFSVPTTLAETRSYTSTTHLRPTESRASSGGGTLANLPPSPPIHKDRERRRLRKKSRPSPGSTYEMGSVSGRSRPRKSGESMSAYPYSFSDGELEDIRERERERDVEDGAGERILPRRDGRRTPSPPPQPYASSSGMLGVPGVSVGVSGASDDGHSAPGKQREEVRGGSVPATPKGPGALLSRIGSLTNRWGGGRRRRGASGPPNEGDTQATPRPQSSMSSLHLPPAPMQQSNSSPGSAAANPSPNGPRVQSSSSSWFFRSSSNTSAATSHKTGRKSLGTRHPSSSTNGERRMGGDGRASLSVTDLPNHDESEYEEYGHPEGEQVEWEYSYQQEWDALDDRTPVATPSKLVKRKSLGFVQLRRSMIAGGEKHKLKVKDRERDGGKESDPAATEKKKKRASDVFTRTTPSKEGKGDPFVVPFAASKSTSSYVSSSPHHHLDSTAEHSPSKEELPASVGSPSPSGLRSIMGNVRRLSIVSAQAAAAVVTTRHRHKRTQSSSAVAGGSTSPEAVARTSLSAVRDRQAMAQTPIRAGGVLGVRRRESGRDSGKEGNGRPLTPSTSVPALQQMYNASDSSRTSVYGHGRKRSGTDVDLASRVGRRGEAEKENRPVTTESEASGAENEKGRDSEREKAVGVLLSEPMLEPNLLPPIELQPPSPPRKSGERSRKGEVQPLALDDPEVHANYGLETKPGLSPRSPPTSSSPRTPRKLRDPNSPQSASVGRASPLQPPPPSAFNHKVDPSTSSNSNTSTVKASKSKDPLVNVVASSSVLRRNSLGDLKIPARISQAQVSLRRDLGMVREFAGAVESLKDLQDTYHALSGDLHALLERHAQASAAASAQARSSAPSPPPDDSQQCRPPSSSGFFNLANLSRTHLKFKGRKRSNTNPENARGSLSGRNTPYHEESVNSSTAQLPLSSGAGVQTLAVSQAAYKELATALYSINSKYRISWECAELLIELGSGTTNADAGPKTNLAIPSPNLAATASASASALPTVQAIVPQRTASGRERAVTLAGDDRDTSRASTPVSRSSSRIGSYGYSGHAPPIASPLHGGMTAAHSTPAVPVSINGIGMGPPLASPPSWRASTGRNDLSQRQLSLLRDMLHADGSSRERPPSSMGRAAALTVASPNAYAAGSHTRLSIAEEPRAVSPNREWRWGADAMSSTITLPVTDDEEEGETGTDRTGGRGKAPKPKKKRLMNMSGFRDMLRALRRGTQAQAAESNPPKQHRHQDATQGQQVLLARSGAAVASTTSLSTGSSHDGHSLHSNHQHRHQRAQQPGQPSQTQRRLIQKRRPKSSAGPEEILAHQHQMQQIQRAQRPPATPPPPPSSFPHPPKSPRRPSLASIFRIGTKSSQQHSSGNATDSNASYVNGSSSSSCLGEDDRRPGYMEEEDWDQIDTASDLDGMAVSRLDTTIRGGGPGKPQVLEKKMKKRMMLGSSGPPPSAAPIPSEPVATGKRSPYLQQDPYAYRSTSGLGRRIVSASSAPMPSANASSSSVNAIPNANGSQASLVASGSVRGSKDGPAPPVPPVGEGTGSVRQTKLSDVQENEAGEAAIRASASLSRQTAQAFIHPKGPSASPHTSRSVSASSKLTSNKTGSVRSMPPQPFSPSSISSASGVTSPYTGISAGGSGGGYPDIKLTFTPENIKPLLENAKEVQKALNECVEELKRLVKREEVRLGVWTGQAVPDQLSS